MPQEILRGPLSPPPGRPSWGGRSDLPLIYLGWGRRDFQQAPLALHCDQATNYYILLRGEIIVHTQNGKRSLLGPAALVVDEGCAFGLTQSSREKVEILVWVWKGNPLSPALRPTPGSFLTFSLQRDALASLAELHVRCRNEVACADSYLTDALGALRRLVEVELLRASGAARPTADYQWALASSWMMNNLSIHAPIPALCDYLRMSPSTLHRFFRQRANASPGAYFRNLKLKEARRLILELGWQVKATAYHLGYRHPNELSRALAAHSTSK